MSDDIFTLHRGSTPLLISLPHVGTVIPDDQKARYVERALAVEDTDWHLERLYGFARELGASVLVPRYSRYLVDLNRPPENAPMYPGVNNTELCPTRFFTGDALYREAQAPDEAEIRRRVASYWRPYHDALNLELNRLRAAHGHAVLFDGHSIKSELPWLFEGKLWDLNLGTAQGSSCHPDLRLALATVLAGQQRYTQIVDGRFKGGHITRHYGRPAQHIHAVQLEMCWSCYMEEAAPFAWHDERAAAVQPLLRQLVQTMLDWRP
ncbi:N-formylglutamate deformylase [Aquabacterium sp.]|uniref:N-formylglutamate deformylase n=1 Tax=Aquabacterium sp. TaxID=1872578 RepID=UPI003783DE06